MVAGETSLPGVERYLSLDLSPSSEIAKNLLDRVPQDARGRGLSLTGDGDAGATSANLTPAMNAWLTKWIVPHRQAALAAVQNAASRIRLGGNTQGIIAEIEDDRLKRERNTRRSDETAKFYEKHRDDIDQLNQVQLEHDRMRAEEADRSAKTPSRFVDTALILLIAIPEGFINYSSFFLWTGLGVLALGMTLVVALAIGLASFMTGRFWKAYHFYMRPDDEEWKARGYRMIGIASLLLSVSLSFVGVARYRTVMEQVAQALILGLPVPNVYTQTGSLLVGNFLIFVIGAAITYWIHDENPHFAEKAAELKRRREALDDAKTKDLETKLANIDRAYQQNRNKMLGKSRLMETQPDYLIVSEAMGNIAAKDGEVIGLLQDYRCALVDTLEQRDPEYKITASSVDRQGGNASPVVGLSEFAAMQLYLYRCS